MTPTSTTPSMKLLIDTKSQRVLYAEAGKDVVDFLFSLLTMPVGDHGGSVASIGNLYSSAKKLDAAPADVNAAVLWPPSCASGGGNGAVVMYTVMDDLKVVPMSTISGIARLSTLGVKDIGALQEKTVQLGYAEGMEIIKASLQSKTVLTDVFVGKKSLKYYMAPSKRCVAKICGGIFLFPFMCGLVVMLIVEHQSRMY